MMGTEIFQFGPGKAEKIAEIWTFSLIYKDFLCVFTCPQSAKTLFDMEFTGTEHIMNTMIWNARQNIAYMECTGITFLKTFLF